MARRKKDAKTTAAILKAYAAGGTLAELKQKFGISGKSALASVVLEALIATGKMPPIARGRGTRKEVPAEFKLAVNKRGTVVIPKEAVVDSFRFAEGQAFVARRRGKKIILTVAG